MGSSPFRPNFNSKLLLLGLTRTNRLPSLSRLDLVESNQAKVLQRQDPSIAVLMPTFLLSSLPAFRLGLIHLRIWRIERVLGEYGRLLLTLLFFTRCWSDEVFRSRFHPSYYGLRFLLTWYLRLLSCRRLRSGHSQSDSVHSFKGLYFRTLTQERLSILFRNPFKFALFRWAALAWAKFFWSR